MGEPVSFLRLSKKTQELNEIALGVKLGYSGFLYLNPDKSKEFAFEETDLVVVLAQQIYS